jgi:ERCC4-related helicase
MMIEARAMEAQILARILHAPFEWPTSLGRQAVTPERDAKLKELKQLIEHKVKDPTTNKRGELNKKVLVFTAFADTAEYLFDSLRSWAHQELGINIALVSGGGGNQTTFGKTDFNQILTNFSPRSKNRDKIPTMPHDAEIDLLIATDCIC